MAETKPLTRRESKKKSTREKLYRAGLRLIRKRGYDAVTIADITDAAGTAKGTFFNYFDTKADIIAAWYETASLPAPEVKIDNLSDALDLAVYKPFEALLSEPELLAAKFAHENDNRSVARAEAEVDRRMFEILEAALCQEEARKGPYPVGASDLASLIVAILTGAAREWRLGGQKEPLSDTVRRRLDSLFTLLDKARLT